MRIEIDDLLGTQWAIPANPPATHDCWTTALEVRKRMGLKSPTYASSASARRHIRNPDTVWTKLDAPTVGCIVRLGYGADHCGVYLGRGRVIHCEHKIGVCVMELKRVTQLYSGCADFWELTDA